MSLKKATSYRRNVAIVVLNEEGKLLACCRSDISEAWQLPQGGIDPGESPQEAMYRELEEEIGTNDVELIGQLPDPIKYSWPEELQRERGYLGQEQSYFLVRLNDIDKINLAAHGDPPEFSECQWLSVEGFLPLVSGFKIEAYKTALELFLKNFPDQICVR